ncbi:MAG: carbohydrate kinase family protein [Candidatus Paceibacterota bacterium]|jgi:ribokinase
MFDVTTIGSVTRDAFFEVPSFPTIVDKKTSSGKAFLLPLGDKFDVENVFFTIGGNAANASVTFARQGLETACVGRRGGDMSGEGIVRRLIKEAVETKFLSTDGRLPTSYSVLLVKGGERTILNYHGASNNFGLRDVPFSKLKSAWWYVSLAGDSSKMYPALMAHAIKNNIAVAFNPSGYHLMRHRADILRSLKNLSLLALNEEEAALLVGIPFSRSHDVYTKLARLMPHGIVVITNGSKGVAVSDGKRLCHAGIFKEKKLVDRTGAGDAFGSAFVAALIQCGIGKKNIGSVTQKQIGEAIRVASANATAVVERYGATEGILSKRELANPRWGNLPIKVVPLRKS